MGNVRMVTAQMRTLSPTDRPVSMEACCHVGRVEQVSLVGSAASSICLALVGAGPFRTKSRRARCIFSACGSRSLTLSVHIASD